MTLSRSTTSSRGRHIRRFSGGPWEACDGVTASLERGLYERSRPSERGNGTEIFCIVRKSPGLHPAVSQAGREREALLLSCEAGSALVAPDHSRTSERSSDRWPVRAESEYAALQMGGNRCRL